MEFCYNAAKSYFVAEMFYDSFNYTRIKQIPSVHSCCVDLAFVHRIRNISLLWQNITQTSKLSNKKYLKDKKVACANIFIGFRMWKSKFQQYFCIFADAHWHNIRTVSTTALTTVPVQSINASDKKYSLMKVLRLLLRVDSRHSRIHVTSLSNCSFK